MRKARLISHFVTSKIGKQIAQYLKKLQQPGNEINHQLIEYNMRNIFLENHTQNVVGKLVPDLFKKNQN